jgi:quercetin dioxygenase-like cupin family protein
MINNEKNVESVKVNHPDAKNTMMRVLIGPKEGWEGNVMRSFELAEGGHSPKHTHDWPHINYVLEGNGILFLNGKENEISKGSIAYVPSGELHQFINTGKNTLKFICIVPEIGHTF